MFSGNYMYNCFLKMTTVWQEDNVAHFCIQVLQMPQEFYYIKENEKRQFVKEFATQNNIYSTQVNGHYKSTMSP